MNGREWSEYRDPYYAWINNFEELIQVSYLKDKEGNIHGHRYRVLRRLFRPDYRGSRRPRG